MKTEDKIIAALFHLLEHTPFDRISVQSICEEAKISRVTFYAYFSNLNSIFSFLVFDRYLQNKMNPYRNIKDALQAATQFVIKHQIFFKKLLSSSRRKEFIEFLQFQSFKHHQRWLDKFDNLGLMGESERQLMSTFYAAGFTHLMVNWVDANFLPKKADFIHQNYLIFKGYIQHTLFNFEFYNDRKRLPDNKDYNKLFALND
jgi:AcrR family transcriptional regulator